MKRVYQQKSPFLMAIGILVIAITGLFILADLNDLNRPSYAAPVKETDVKIANITTVRDETTISDDRISGPSLNGDTNITFTLYLLPGEEYTFVADVYNNTRTNTTLENHDFIVTKDDLVTSDIDYTLTLEGMPLASVLNSDIKYIKSVINGNSKKELKVHVVNTSGVAGTYNFNLEMEFLNK